ncbi:uncharacterized protein CIMG_12543 [Coccidioides immitis RS]|uniref:Uncharacterized protein n=4 Tax=Coccidioides immitis TaxID=5501 RepID=A0A0D8JVZ3_COCIM|nr:uncharacterized protein CIMG_12543 [Coccidioides immitis RS]KJF61284.1 hypothetical protein CIMG_12543 [Coccidioides immitis RS]KMP09672.1 hypothetical protein CIRG_09842 [Coccidioides immitis RMSCC 2394]KMU81426.1 hypothetical protein CISG_09139 [Coccidioides immitis RMSCC 3703]KMU90839.1 hypothetical protein CIHG_08643 [Coccidioides immitis H538.4]
MAASYYYRDHPYNHAPGPAYPLEPYTASNGPDDLVYKTHSQRRHTDAARPSSASRRSRRDGYRSTHNHEHRGGRKHKHRDDYYQERPSYSHFSLSRSPSPKPRRRKSLGEQAMAALGLAGSSSRGNQHHRTRTRDRSYDYSDPRSRRDHDHPRRRREHRQRNRNSSRSPSPDAASKEIRHAITAALAAGAAEAYRARKAPGGWTGEKGKRVLTAAIGAGGMDKLIERDPNKHNKRHILESTIAGLATNHLMNGSSRSRSHRRHSRRSRSEDHSGMKSLATAGVLAAAGKKAYDHYRSESRGRSPCSGYSSDEDVQPRRHRKKRSQSVTDYVAKGLAALGLTDDVDDKRRSTRHREYDHSSSDDDDYSDYRPRRRERHSGRSR